VEAEVSEALRAITDAARIVRARLPSHHGFDLHDLVSIGYEAVATRGLEATDQRILVFIRAKQAMITAARKWSGRSACGYQRRTFLDPMFSEYDDGVAVWDQWRRHALPLESMIDMKRALLAMRLREAVAWYSHHWLEEDRDHLRRELGVGDVRLGQYCAAARAQLAAAWLDGDPAPVGKASQTPENADRRKRYSDLKRLGATTRQAQKNLTPTRYAAMVRQLTPEAAE
jgi:hypothetical protein